MMNNNIEELNNKIQYYYNLINQYNLESNEEIINIINQIILLENTILKDNLNTKIQGFFKENRFLSNFYQSPVVYQDISYPSSEHAFVAAKTNDKSTKEYISTIKTAKEVKIYGKKIQLRKDWNQVKYQEMHNIVLAKFKQNKNLAKKLLETKNSYLEETNHWGDQIWGVSDNVGYNHLGRILMSVRSELNNNNNNNNPVEKNKPALNEEKIEIIYSSSSKPGGQNVNRNLTRVTVKIKIDDLNISDDKKEVLKKLFTNDIISTTNQDTRSQLQNKKNAIKALNKKIEMMNNINNKRIKSTKPDVIKSKEQKNKKYLSDKKSSRKKVDY